MSVEQILLVITAVVALIALTVAVAALRRLSTISKQADPPASAPAPASSNAIDLPPPLPPVGQPEYDPLPARRDAPEVEVLDGAIVVRPSNRQVVEATMGRPLVRLNIVLFGLTHALRADSRDRLRSLMRREFRARKSLRRKQARRAARLSPDANSSAAARLSRTARAPELSATDRDHQELEP